jgi:hypothetical protein
VQTVEMKPPKNRVLADGSYSEAHCCNQTMPEHSKKEDVLGASNSFSRGYRVKCVETKWPSLSM